MISLQMSTGLENLSLDVMRLLTLSRVGLLLTNESICEIMQSTLSLQ